MSLAEGTPNIFPADWCARTGATERDSAGTVLAVANTYISSTAADCRTRGLTASLNRQGRSDWRNYLVSYTLAMAGCPLLFGPLDDGVLAFGPANTQAIGVKRPPLGEDDVTSLIQHYTTAFASELELDIKERDAVGAYLWQSATDELGPAVSGALSMCDAPPDAGM